MGPSRSSQFPNPRGKSLQNCSRHPCKWLPNFASNMPKSAGPVKNVLDSAVWKVSDFAIVCTVLWWAQNDMKHVPALWHQNGPNMANTRELGTIMGAQPLTLEGRELCPQLGFLCPLHCLVQAELTSQKGGVYRCMAEAHGRVRTSLGLRSQEGRKAGKVKAREHTIVQHK